MYNPFQKTNGLGFYIDPQYINNPIDKKIVLFANYNYEDAQRSFSFEFDPAIKTQVTVVSTR